MTVYAKITDRLECFAHFAFEGHNKVYPELEYYEDASKYSVVDGELVDISSTDEYKTEELEKAKVQKLNENTRAMDAKKSFSTSLGVVNINTPIGRIDVVATSMLNIVNLTKENLPEGFFRVYIDGVPTPSPEMTPEQVGAFYLEIAQKFQSLDSLYKNYENSIKAAKSIEELETIEFVYTYI